MMTQQPATGVNQPLMEKYKEFFFKTEVPYGLALLRILLPLVIFCDLLPRWFHARELFSLDGAPVPLWSNYGLFNWQPLFSAEITVALMTALMCLLLSLSIGWCSRFSALAVFVLYAYFGMTDSVSTITKYVVIARMSFYY